jgi:hypothetical protein
MKSRILMCITAMTLFATLAIPVRLAAQDAQDHSQLKNVRYTITDLGTLGGTFSDAGGANNRGLGFWLFDRAGDTATHALL